MTELEELKTLMDDLGFKFIEETVAVIRHFEWRRNYYKVHASINDDDTIYSLGIYRTKPNYFYYDTIADFKKHKYIEQLCRKVAVKTINKKIKKGEL